MLPPTPGERFVVCSDGLSNELDDREIMLVARKYADPQIAADQLVAAAVRAGGRDNVSVVVVAVDAGATTATRTRTPHHEPACRAPEWSSLAPLPGHWRPSTLTRGCRAGPTRARRFPMTPPSILVRGAAP